MVVTLATLGMVPLLLAAKFGAVNKKYLDALLEKGADINVTDDCGRTALMLTLLHRHENSFLALLEAGADVNLSSVDGKTALMIAAVVPSPGCLQQLINYGAALDTVDGMGRTALINATEWGCTDSIEVLLKAGANFDTKDHHERTALMVAAVLSNAPCLKILVKYGATVDKDVGGGITPLMVAAGKGDRQCLTALIEAGAVIDDEDLKGKTAVMCAAEKGQAMCLVELLQAGGSVDSTDEKGLTAAMYASMCQQVDCLQLLIEFGAALDIVDAKGRNALMLAAKYGSANCLRLLLSLRHDLSITDRAGYTALMHSVGRKSNEECFETMLNTGSDVNAQNRYGHTALMFAVRWWNKLSRVHRLLQAGANVNLTSFRGVTALMFAAGLAVCDMENTEECRNLGCPPNTMGDDVYSLHAMEALIRAGANVNLQDNCGRTALMIAAECEICTDGYLQVLLRAGADVNARDRDGKTALMYLTHHTVPPNRDDEQDLEQYFTRHARAANALCRADANVNAQDNDGMTPLMHAIFHIDMAETLMSVYASHGVDLELSDNTGRTALTHALENARHDYSIAFSLYDLRPYPVLNPVHRSVVMEIITFRDYYSEQQALWNAREFGVQLFLCNGIAPRLAPIFPQLSDFNSTRIWVPLYEWFRLSVSQRRRKGEERYLLANCFITTMDKTVIRRSPDLSSFGAGAESVGILKEALRSPWPLVKLALIVVSTELGPSPGREERVRRTGLPVLLQECLLFQRPEALLHHDWDKIPIVFNPNEYAKLPHPYPLLYNWPFGHEIVDCECLDCREKDRRFRMKRIRLP